MPKDSDKQKTSGLESTEKVRKWLDTVLQIRQVSLGELARSIGKSESWISKFRKKEIKSIDTGTTIQIAKTLGVNPEDILQEAWALSTKEVKNIVETYESTNRQARIHVRDYLEFIKYYLAVLPRDSKIYIFTTKPLPIIDQFFLTEIRESLKQAVKQNIVYHIVWAPEPISDVGVNPRGIEASYNDLCRELKGRIAPEEIEKHFVNNSTIIGANDEFSKKIECTVGFWSTLMFFSVRSEGESNRLEHMNFGAKFIETLKLDPTKPNGGTDRAFKNPVNDVSGWVWLSNESLNLYKRALYEIVDAIENC